VEVRRQASSLATRRLAGEVKRATASAENFFQVATKAVVSAQGSLVIAAIARLGRAIEADAGPSGRLT
jgi:hypothetical protein